MSDHLQSFLADRDEPCPNCRYNLRGLTGNVCPECQQELSLRVGMTDTAWKSLVTTIVGLTFGGGAFCAVLIAVLVTNVVYGESGGLSRFKWFVYYPLTVAIVFGTSIVLLTRLGGRRWFRSLSPTWRAACAVLAWCASFAVIFGWFGALMD